MSLKQSTDRSRLRKLFLTMLYISAFTFGGGFAIVTFMKEKFVDELHWIDEDEMLDMTAMAQSAPGAIAVNAAILMGWRVSGVTGMLVAVVGTIVPPMVILGIVSLFYAAFSTNPYVALVLRGMQAGVAAVILNVSLQLGGKILKQERLLNLVLMIAAFIATFVFHVNVVLIILAAAALGLIRSLTTLRRERAE